jgi:hypothetical protein
MKLILLKYTRPITILSFKSFMVKGYTLATSIKLAFTTTGKIQALAPGGEFSRSLQEKI